VGQDPIPQPPLLDEKDALKPKVSVKRPTAVETTPQPFQSLANVAPTPVPDEVKAYVTRGQATAPAAPAAQGDTLEAAQQRAADHRLMAGLTRAGMMAGSAIGHHGGQVDEGALAGIDGSADEALKAYAAREADREKQKALAEAAAKKDPNSAGNRALTTRLSKMFPGLDMTGLTEDALPTFLETGKLKSQLDKETAEGKYHEGELSNAQAKMAAEERMHRETLAVERAKVAAMKDKSETKAGQLKKVDAQELVRLKTMENAINSLDEASKVYEGAIPFTPSGVQWSKTRQQLAPTLAAAQAPNARENISLIEHAEKMLPESTTPNALGKPQLASQRKQLLDNYKALVESMRQSGYDMTGFHPEALEKGSAGGAEPPHGETVVQNGVTFRWNPQTKNYE
jgi:hypothetical protein